MKIVRQQIILQSKINRAQILKKIEQIGRICYKSENKATSDSAAKFVEMLIKRNHLSVLEHVSLTVKFITDRGISHELVRHRIASYSQECLSGDTVVNKNGTTIRQLFDRNKNSYGRTHNKTIVLRSVNHDGYIVRNKIQEVFYKGRAIVFEVTTSLGYKIKATMNHKFMIDGGRYTTLRNLKGGSKVMVNGRPTLVAIQDSALRRYYMQDKMTPCMIGRVTGANIRYIYKRLKELKIFESHKNVDPSVYTRNHTDRSYKKMIRTIKDQYKNGRRPWNAGLDSSDPRMAKVIRALMKHRHKNGFAENNSNWKGDGVRLGYGRTVRSNVALVCASCHNKFHHGWWITSAKKAHLDTVVSIREIGETDVYDLEMRAPYNNYVANGFVVHNSTRYCNYGKSGEIAVILPGDVPIELTNPMNGEWAVATRAAERGYLTMIASGVPPQVARAVLPNCLKTEIVVTANLREWMLILDQRTSVAAHPDMRRLMRPLLRYLRAQLPEIFHDQLGDGSEFPPMAELVHHKDDSKEVRS